MQTTLLCELQSNGEHNRRRGTRGAGTAWETYLILVDNAALAPKIGSLSRLLLARLRVCYYCAKPMLPAPHPRPHARTLLDLDASLSFLPACALASFSVMDRYGSIGSQTERVAPYLTSQAALVPKIPAGIVVLASLPLLCVLGQLLSVMPLGGWRCQQNFVRVLSGTLLLGPLVHPTYHTSLVVVARWRVFCAPCFIAHFEVPSPLSSC